MTYPFPDPPQIPPTGPRIDISTVYRRAVEVLDERGWCQEVAEDRDGRVCALGALRVSAFGDANSYDDDLEHQVLRPLHDHLGQLVAPWNDAPERTEDDVKAALLAVAESVGPSVMFDGKAWEVTR